MTPPTPQHESYLGDGVYASFDGYHIWLKTEREGRQHTIALEPGVLQALKDYEKVLRVYYEKLKQGLRP